MPRSVVVLILLVVIVAAAILFLSTRATEVPTRTFEVEVAGEKNAQ